VVTLTADEHLHEVLEYIVEPAEIRDASGKVLGHYTPLVPPDIQEAYDRLAAQLDHDELDRLAQSNEPGYTIEQVMEHLRQLEQSEHDLHRGVDTPGVPDTGRHLDEGVGSPGGDCRQP
jgi:hypothetical protein